MFHDRNSQPNMMNQVFTVRIYRSIVRSFSLSFFLPPLMFFPIKRRGRENATLAPLLETSAEKNKKERKIWLASKTMIADAERSGAENSYSRLGDDAGEGEGGWCLSAWAESNGGREGT
jgi:hypothetical protein